jgi:hypothetical protein
MAKLKTNFPKTLYVYQDSDGDDVFYVASGSIEGLGDDVHSVASYKLCDVSRLVITRELKP